MREESMPLADAVLCLDCDTVYSAFHLGRAGRHTCPCCGSAVGWLLRMWVKPMNEGPKSGCRLAEAERMANAKCN